MTQPTPPTHERPNWSAWAYGLFWSWNLIFLAFLWLGFAPLLLPDLLRAARAGEIPPGFLACGVILAAIPLVAVILGLTLLRRSPGRLLALGYGVEGPLMLLVALRFFIVRELTPASGLLFAVAGLGMLAFLWHLLDGRSEARGRLTAYPRAAGLALMLLTGLYVGVWLAFYAVILPVGVWEALREWARAFSENARSAWAALGRGDWIGLGRLPWGWLPFWLLAGVLGLFSATLLVALPVVAPILYGRAWWRDTRALIRRDGPLPAVALALIVLAICSGLAFWTNRQPQHAAFALLDRRPATAAEAEALLTRQDQLRAGLLNAYLAPFRYISAAGEVRHVTEMYKWALRLPEPQAEQVQRAYETVAQPLLYQPVRSHPAGKLRADNTAFVEEPAEAARLYKAFFDRTIIKGERAAVVSAVRSTWSVAQAQAALQAVDDAEVYLARQEVTVAEHGDWADVELYEAYQNRTSQRQEVVYYFSLPESAVITGVWLGNSADRSQRFPFQVAPRGAAQAVYRNELRRQQDPALVEQIGPRQYRLRIFPVDPRRWQGENGQRQLDDAPPLHLWLAWRVLVADGGWPLPRLAEKRNVFWDGDSVRLLNGQPMIAAAGEWLPRAAPASAAARPIAHRVDFGGGQIVVVRPAGAAGATVLPANLRLAVVVDRSRSMAAQADRVAAALARLGQVTAAAADVYLTSSPYRSDAPSLVSLAGLDAAHILYFGGQNAAELLTQFAALRAGRAYNAVLVLTDDTGYELAGDGAKPPVSDVPVWMVHLGGDLPLGYDDGTLQALQASGGGAAGSVDEALVRLAAARDPVMAATTADLVDGYVWTTAPTGQADGGAISHGPDDGFAALAGRRLILAAMQRQRATLEQPETLDRLHAIAVQQAIVTPYSSMIVLVNARQEDLLRRLSEEADRFDREYEDLGETTPQNPLAVAAVPEPEEWLLLILAAGLLAWSARTRLPRRLPG